MGHQPPRITIIPPPTRESFHLGRAREAYVRGEIHIHEFEELVHHVIVNRGHLTKDLRIPSSEQPDFNESPFSEPELEEVGGSLFTPFPTRRVLR